MSVPVAEVVYQALYFIFPAYCANAAPVIFGGGTPIDRGKTFRDGRPILGPRKTFRGFFAGLAIGTLVGLLQNPNNVLLGFTLSLGALTGDLVESFFKRRLNIPPGASFPVADQLDFIAGALLFSLLVSPPSLTVETIAVIVVITPPIHLLTNIFAYLLKLKKEPW
ncbi:MAG: CDP-2,3-bis-(O-geranylgeranyl)-sn-glycerol synthase [Candidatus Bathyarchaeia archaeon]